MCKLCDQGEPQNHFGSRRNFLKGAVATGVAAAGLNLFAARPAAADDPPMDSGRLGRRYVIRGGSVMSIDPQVGDFAQADGCAIEDAGFVIQDTIMWIYGQGFPERPHAAEAGLRADLRRLQAGRQADAAGR
jgi:hypothetical protein